MEQHSFRLLAFTGYLRFERVDHDAPRYAKLDREDYDDWAGRGVENGWITEKEAQRGRKAPGMQ